VCSLHKCPQPTTTTIRCSKGHSSSMCLCVLDHSLFHSRMPCHFRSVRVSASFSCLKIKQKIDLAQNVGPSNHKQLVLLPIHETFVYVCLLESMYIFSSEHAFKQQHRRVRTFFLGSFFHSNFRYARQVLGKFLVDVWIQMRIDVLWINLWISFTQLLKKQKKERKKKRNKIKDLK
jgi:hypothetical protein